MHRHGRRRGGPPGAWLAGLALGTLAAGTLAAGTPAALGAPPALPALVQPQSQQRHEGKIVFAQLVTPSLQAAESFYGGLFGWRFQEIPDRGVRFAIALQAGQPVAAVLEKALPAASKGMPYWLTYISVPDTDAAVRRAVAGGAHLLFGPSSIAGLGRRAILTDPQGAPFALLASSSGDPPDDLAAVGGWVWSSLITTDPQAAGGFYRSVLDYELYPLPDPEDRDHLILASGGFARAGVSPLPVRRPDAGPAWIDFVRVDDVAATAGRAPALGGKVLVPPHQDRKGDMVALLADPAGAVFGVMAVAVPPDPAQQEGGGR